MGANYISIQVADTRAADVRAMVQAANAGGEGISIYLGPQIGRWTALYPAFGPTTDTLAKLISRETGGVVVTLASLDEDDLICNVCIAGKDRSYFRVTVGSERKGKRRDPVVKRLDMLADFADLAARAALADKLCDLREVTFGSDALDWFCATFGIANARCNHDYIRANDYEHDLDQVVSLEHLPAGP